MVCDMFEPKRTLIFLPIQNSQATCYVTFGYAIACSNGSAGELWPSDAQTFQMDGKTLECEAERGVTPRMVSSLKPALLATEFTKSRV